MAQRYSILEWQTLLDDTEWAREESLDQLLVTAQPSGARQPRKSASTLKRVAAGFALLTALACTLLVRFEAQKGLDNIETEVREIVDIEDWGRQRNNLAAVRAFVDSEADPRWRKEYLSEIETNDVIPEPDALLHETEVDRIRLRADQAMVQVAVSDQSGETCRETRFYREEADGWLRTSPLPAFWGPEQALETTYFCILYRQADALAVVEASTELDKLYLELHTDLGLPAGTEKLTVEVAPLPLVVLGFLGFEEAYLMVPSPLLLQRPADLPDSAILFQTVAYPLVVRVWEEETQNEISEAWRDGARLWWWPMVRGMQIWQANGGGQPAAHWFAETAAWLYGDAALRSGRRPPSPLDPRTLCSDSAIWRHNVPFVPSSPLDCLGSEWQADLERMAAPAATLAPLIYLGDGEASATSLLYGDWARSMAAATVVEYLVQTYGREQLPHLVDGFRTHDRWEMLIPDLLGISAQEFENGWRAFLADEYGFDDEVHSGLRTRSGPPDIVAR